MEAFLQNIVDYLTIVYHTRSLFVNMFTVINYDLQALEDQTIYCLASRIIQHLALLS